MTFTQAISRFLIYLALYQLTKVKEQIIPKQDKLLLESVVLRLPACLALCMHGEFDCVSKLVVLASMYILYLLHENRL